MRISTSIALMLILAGAGHANAVEDVPRFLLIARERLRAEAEMEYDRNEIDTWHSGLFR